jgi:hypothetical protein
MRRPATVSRGVMAEFASPEALIAAVDRLYERGYRRLDAFTPYPVRALEDKITPRSPVAAIMLVAGIAGALFGYGVQWWCAVVAWPLNVGGRPPHSAPAFIPIAFESAVLFAAVTGFFALLALCRLPRLHHPVFEVDGFERASVDRFWIAVDATDDAWEPDLKEKLVELGALRVTTVGGGL